MNELMRTRINHEEVTEQDRVLAESVIAQADPDSVLASLLRQVLVLSKSGFDISVLALDSEVTPNQAAKLLNMSRPQLLSFMDHGDLPYHRVGATQKHRKIKLTDLLGFMSARDEGRKMTAQAMYSDRADYSSAPELSEAEKNELNSL